MPYRTIVVGTDGSETASVAVGAATRLAKRCKAKLVVVSALEGYGLTERAIRDAWRPIAAAAEKAKLDAVFELEQGRPGPALLGVAERYDADLLVLGNKGLGKATRLVLGSVPDSVAWGAPADLLIVDTTKAQTGRSAPPFMRIVAGTDGSPTASDAVRRGFDLAGMWASQMNLVFVGDPLVGAIRLEEAASEAPEEVDVQRIVEQGEPADQIVSVADRVGADLVIVGNKGMAGMRRLLGSVPNQVAHEVPTNVLIVKTVDRTIDDLAPGLGGVVRAGGKQVAVYIDPDGTRRAFNPRCTHMGCTVGWNGAELTWDCPCHGSRFATDGTVIHGPAQRPLDPADL
jgi:nucleotide-binding universal stress UspA family protein/nitrite reductase/ring-hydroxylating ferredoxin subunit